MQNEKCKVQSEGQVIVGLRVVGVDAHSPFEGLDGLIVQTLIKISISQVKMGLSEVRVQVQCSFAGSDRIVHPIEL